MAQRSQYESTSSSTVEIERKQQPLYIQRNLSPNFFIVSTVAGNFDIGGRFVSETSTKMEGPVK
jgi:hypothetical protein